MYRIRNWYYDHDTIMDKIFWVIRVLVSLLYISWFVYRFYYYPTMILTEWKDTPILVYFLMPEGILQFFLIRAFMKWLIEDIRKFNSVWWKIE